MKWKFWESEPTAAQQSLDEMQAQEAHRPPPPVETQATPDKLPIEAEADAHMITVMQRLEELMTATPGPAPGGFMLEVTSVEPAADGAVALSGGAHHGSVDAGDVVGLMIIPVAPRDHEEPHSEQCRRRDAEELLQVSAAAATVVSWQASPPTLVLSGVSTDDVVVGSMVAR